MPTSVDFVTSPLATRIFWVSKETGSPMPQFSQDDVTDYMVKEAIVTRVAFEKNQKAKIDERVAWRKNHKEWAKEMGLVG